MKILWFTSCTVFLVFLVSLLLLFGYPHGHLGPDTDYLRAAEDFVKEYKQMTGSYPNSFVQTSICRSWMVPQFCERCNPIPMFMNVRTLTSTQARAILPDVQYFLQSQKDSHYSIIWIGLNKNNEEAFQHFRSICFASELYPTNQDRAYALVDGHYILLEARGAWEFKCYTDIDPTKGFREDSTGISLCE